MNVGWIALPRDIADHWLWNNPRRLRMWMQLVFMANWEKGFAIWGTKRVELERGQFSTTMRALARSLECTKQTLLTFLQLLEDDGMIRREMPGNKFTIITIVDYDEIYSPRTSGKSSSAGTRKGVCKKKKSAQNAPSETSAKPVEKNSSESIEKGGEKGLENDVKNDVKNNDFSEEKNGEKSENGQFARQTLDRKLDRSIYNKEINNKKSISSSSRAREKNKKIFETINSSENFWRDAAQGLGMDSTKPDTIPKLKRLGSMYAGEVLSKGKEEMSESEMRTHLFNWIRKNQELESQRNNQKSNNNGKTEIDSRRGFDAPAPEQQAVSGRRF